LPDSGLHIIGETLTRVRISLMALPGVPLSAITQALAHPVLLPQARRFLSNHAITPVSAVDSAGAAADLTKSQNRERGVLASALAAEIYGLNILAKNIEDHGHNTTRFLHMARTPDFTHRGSGKMMTTFVFQVRNIPAALYKAMGGFATNGVNMTKLESYMVGGSFQATQFYADIQGHPEDESVQLALEELAYFTSELKILGTYPADTAR
jgi:prephenate dehydratase